jgi:hypothetical protein
VLKSMPLVSRGSYDPPHRLNDGEFAAVVPAHWVVPSRCFLAGHRIKKGIITGTELFYAFKAGEAALAYPFARSILCALKRRRLAGFDCIVPVPLSPDKIRKGELHRSRALARELSRRLGIPVVQLLLLRRAVSKRRMLARGYSNGAFRERYRHALSVTRRAKLWSHSSCRRCVHT